MKLSHPSHSQGQSLVEFSLLLWAFLLLAVVTFDLGRGIYYYSVVHNSAREGARYGIINPDDTEGIISNAERLSIGLNQDQLSVVSCECGNIANECIGEMACEVGEKDIIKVQVTYNFQLVTPLVEQVLGRDEFELQSISKMYIER